MPRKTCRFPLIAAVFAASLAVSCAQTQQKASETPDTRAADEATIRTSDTDFAKAAAAKDLDKCMSLYEDDAVLFTPGSPAVIGKDNIRNVIQRMQGMQLTINVASVDVARSGDLALDRGTVQSEVTDKKGKRTEQTSAYVLVWKKQADGTWKVAADTSANEK
ncbi:MAG TPA: SgcJ/EcaC family oxidoreductase [Candidatus Acidoferrales bacterium]